MEEGCPRFCKLGLERCSAANVSYLLRKREKGSKGHWRPSGRPTPTTGPEDADGVRRAPLSQRDGATLPSHGKMSLFHQAWRAEPRTREDYSHVLKSNEVCLAWFWTLAWDLLILSLCLYFPLGVGMSIQCLSQHCILEAHNLSGFTGSQLERNECSRMNHTLSLVHT